MAGVFVLPGLAYGLAGPAALVSFAVAGVLALAGLLSQAELATAMPKAGGTYFYVTRSMGSATGTVYGLITWLSLVLKTAYELVFMAIFVNVLANVPIKGLAVLLCGFFLLINLRGVTLAGRLQVYLVFGILIILGFFCGWSWEALDAANFKPFAPYGSDGILAGAALVFIGFGGLLKVASVAEEIKQPGKLIPLGMILSFLVVMTLYAAVVFVAVAVLGGKLAGSEVPVCEAGMVFLGNGGRIGFALAGILAVLCSANAGIMAASRYPLALARDEMLPGWLGRVHKKFRTPHWSILMTGLVIVAVIFVEVELLVKAASSVLILTYIFTCLAVLILRESRVQNYRPAFRCPLYPWVQLVGLIGLVALLFEIGMEAALICCGLALVGFLMYWFYGRRRARQEYALLHLIERITAKELTTHRLETELKEIIHQRDDILKDRFDHLIEKCPVLDIAGSISREEFFRQAAEVLAADLKMKSKHIYNLLVEREEESTTVLTDELAIPHIIIGGEHHFDILMARCKEGIAFSEEAPKISTVFVLIGTKDERPFHLTSLAAIVQVAQEEGFEEKWRAAKGTEALRDLVLLGKRRRQA